MSLVLSVHSNQLLILSTISILLAWCSADISNLGFEPERRAEVFGLRAEAPEHSFLSYDEQGVCSVEPDVAIKIVIYGINLDQVEAMLFTSSNCSDPIRTVNAGEFLVDFENKAIFTLSLPPLADKEHGRYKVCVQQKNVELTKNMRPLDDPRTFFTTESPPKHHYLPVPIQVSVVAVLFVLSALFSGLTLGLMSLTPMELELVQKSGSPSEQRHASKILPIRRKGNLLLCSLLIGNVIVNSGISILFDDLMSGLLALLVSTIGIVIFGEIIPQSICVKKGLAVGAYTIFLTQFFIFFTFPVAWPISKILDYLLGDEYVSYDRKRLMELIKLSVRDKVGLADELKIAVGAMEISDKVVEDAMTKISDVFMIPDTTVLDTKTVAEILRMGYTRIPVYADGDKNNITDILFVKDLALIDPDDNFTVKTVCGYHRHPVKFVDASCPLPALLEEFKKGDSHMAIVRQLGPDRGTDPRYDLVGVITLEDIVEEILQSEIVDEFDVVTDNVTHRKRTHFQSRDVSKLFEKDIQETMVSMQLQMATVQWLVANEAAFSETLIDRTVLLRLIRNNVRRVDLSTLMALSCDNGVPTVPRTAKLYTKGELTDIFTLILEGRAVVVIGQGEMKFEAGPWHIFGVEVLNKLVANVNSLARSTSAGDGMEMSKIRRPDLAFVPDYSVIVKEDCTFLEVSSTTYINAYRATLMQREIGHRDTIDSTADGDEHYSPIPESLLKSSCFENSEANSSPTFDSDHSPKNANQSLTTSLKHPAVNNFSTQSRKDLKSIEDSGKASLESFELC
ncbi:hypothetical protein AB6A40_002837 [Gnathostoma spinigerum]|uniref:Metal transporter CNNM2 n=1 Tax=Gnathostoma spinigerum TaxID=75299 RepID=A0ABD6E7W5_9BILA